MSRDDLVSAPRGEIVDLDNARLVGDDFAWRLFHDRGARSKLRSRQRAAYLICELIAIGN
jgi:hypothetical protein